MINSLIVKCLIFLTIFLGCSKNKIRLPIKEIDRPISLPPRNWSIGMGAGPIFDKNGFIEPYINILPMFAYPYFKIGRNCEYYIPLVFNYFLINNTELQDSVVYLKGPALSIISGLKGFAYSSEDGYLLSFGTSLLFKKPLNNMIWIKYQMSLDYTTTKKLFESEINTGFGYQISRHYYLELLPSFSHNKNRFNLYSKVNNDEVTEYSIALPLTFGINISKMWSLYFNASGNYDFNKNIIISTLLGFKFIW